MRGNSIYKVSSICYEMFVEKITEIEMILCSGSRDVSRIGNGVPDFRSLEREEAPRSRFEPCCLCPPDS